MDNLSISIDPSQLQVSLEQTQGPPATPQANRSSGKSSPLRGRCVKEYEEQLQQLQHENFNLKLRVFLLEERMGKALGRSDAADIIKNNIELKVENETLKKSLTDKCQLLTQASGAIEELENQQRSVLAAHQAEVHSLKDQMDFLQKELAEAEEARLISNRLPDESVDLYAQAFGSFVINSQQQPTCNHPDHHNKEEVDELLTKIDALTKQLSSEKQEVEKLKLEKIQPQEKVIEYHSRVEYLEGENQQQKLRISQLEEVQSAKESKIAELLKEQDKDGRVVEKDRIIEEKQSQLEQQNKILVEIQITLDEKQKQIQELEGALNDRRKKVEELEKSLSKAGRSIQAFVADIQKKEKEFELAKAEIRKRDKKVKDLTAELKEAQEMFNKAKWEAETYGREDGVKAMAEEENERLWAELEEKKRLLTAAERQRSLLQQEVEQLASFRLAVGQKEQAVFEAESQISTLKRQVSDLQQEVAARARLSMEKAQHSLERKDTAAKETVSIQQQYEEAQSKVERLEKELQRLRAWKKKSESCSTSLNASSAESNLRMYKKEVTVLRQRLADSTNACDLLRTRLEEMADFLEEILSMSQQELLNLSTYSSSKSGMDLRRQALQHSIMQSRELSRSLSHSLMIGVDPSESQLPSQDDEESQRPKTHSSSSAASTSAASSSWSIHSGREKSMEQWSDRHPSLPPPSEIDRVPETNNQQAVVDQLRAIVAQLEEQVKQRDVEIAWLNMERENNNRSPGAVTSNNNKSIHMDSENRNNNMVSSTPYHPSMGQACRSSVLSPVFVDRLRDNNSASRSSIRPTLVSNSLLLESLKKTPETTGGHEPTPASESEAWSEPDRTVSFARIGLPAHQEMHNSIAALLVKKSRPLSTTRDDDSSDSNGSSKGTARRSRSDQHEAKRSGKRIRAVEQENLRLRSQLAEVVDTLRSTYDAQLVKDDPILLDESQNTKGESPSRSIDGISGDVMTARFIIEALQNRLVKMKELVRRREQRLRETKDVASQLELKLKEKNLQSCDVEMQLKETKEKLNEMESRLMESLSTVAVNETLTRDLRTMLDSKESELRGALLKAELWEDSFQTSQKTARQMEADLLTQQEILLQSKSLLEKQVSLLKEDLEVVKQDRAILKSDLDAVREQLKNNEAAHTKAVTSRRSSQPLQRQVSQMSDYVSDQAISAEEAPSLQMTGKNLEQINTPTRPTSLHLSPDLGIDSDPGRFSSLEHSSVERKENNQNSSNWNPKSVRKPEEEKITSAPDVLGTTTTTNDCPNCPKWQIKYSKAKQTLAATLEKLQAANARKEKVDRALNKELGKTHNILCQARGILEQANQASQ